MNASREKKSQRRDGELPPPLRRRLPRTHSAAALSDSTAGPSRKRSSVPLEARTPGGGDNAIDATAGDLINN